MFGLAVCSWHFFSEAMSFFWFSWLKFLRPVGGGFRGSTRLVAEDVFEPVIFFVVWAGLTRLILVVGVGYRKILGGDSSCLLADVMGAQGLSVRFDSTSPRSLAWTADC